MRRFFAAFVAGDPSRFDAILAADYQDHGHDPVGVGVRGARDDYEALTAAFGDLAYDLHDVIAEGYRVAVRWTAHMTNIGPFMGMPATGRRVSMDGFSVYRVAHDRIAATWNLQDVASLREQLTRQDPA